GVELRHLELDYPPFLLDSGKIDEQMEASSAQRLRQLAGAVGGQHHHRPLDGANRAELRHAHLEIGEQLQKESLELLVGLVDLIDQQHHLVRGGDRLEQRALEQVFAREDVLGDVLPSNPLFFRLKAKELLLVVPFIE